MSNKNKLENKSIRRSLRGSVAVVERTPVSPIAQKTSARLLSDPKKKLTGNTRRRLQRSRGFALSLGVYQASIIPEVKSALKLEALPIAKLFRRLKQACRRAATAKYLLLEISPGSKFAAGIVAEQIHQLSLCRQIQAEISVRNHTKH